MPPVNPDDAASGRLAPDPLAAAEEGNAVRLDVDVTPEDGRDDAKRSDR
jgi:hypothetical protein